MCGRFLLTVRKAALERLFQLKKVPELPPRYNITPGQPIVVVRQNPHLNQRELTALTWGLIPFWTKNIRNTRGHINARAESASEKPAFSGPLRHHRCLVPCSGFYEWYRQGKQTTPYLFTPSNDTPIAIAALWDHWGSPDGSSIESCALLTTRANRDMHPIHHRMPVIISPKDFDRWLDPSLQKPNSVGDLLQPPPNGTFHHHPISERINHPQNDDPTLLTPTSPTPIQTELF